MTWTKLSDDYADRLEDLDLSPTACWLNTAARIYCNRVGNDGRLPRSKLGRVSSIDTPEQYAAELEQAGIWEPVAGQDAWQLDWSDQEPAEDVRRRRANAAQRQRRRRLHLAGDHTQCEGDRHCKASVTRDVTRHVTAPRPDPSRPVPEETGTGQRCIHRQPIAADGAGCNECATVARIAQ